MEISGKSLCEKIGVNPKSYTLQSSEWPSLSYSSCIIFWWDKHENQLEVSTNSSSAITVKCHLFKTFVPNCSSLLHALCHLTQRLGCMQRWAPEVLFAVQHTLKHSHCCFLYMPDCTYPPALRVIHSYVVCGGSRKSHLLGRAGPVSMLLCRGWCSALSMLAGADLELVIAGWQLKMNLVHGLSL